MEQKIKIASGGLDLDNSPSFIAEGDYTWAENIRTHSNNIIGASNIAPTQFRNTGEQGAMVPYFGLDQDFAEPQGNEAFSICRTDEGWEDCTYVPFYYTNSVRTQRFRTNVLHILKEVDSVKYLSLYKHDLDNNSLSLICTTRFDSADNPSKCVGLGKNVYFLSQRVCYKVPIDGIASGLTPSQIKDKYLLIKNPAPRSPKLLSSTTQVVPNPYQQGYIVPTADGDTDTIQFASTLVYFDGTETALSPYSQSYPVASSGTYTIGIVDYDGEIDWFYDKGVQRVNLYFRINDDGVWKQGSFYTLPETPPVEISMVFNPRNLGLATLPTLKQNKYFEPIPIESKAIEAINGRIVLGNNLNGYPTIKATAPEGLTYTFNVYSANNNSKTYQKYKTCKAGGLYSIGVFGIDEYNRPTSVTNLGEFQLQRPQSTIRQREQLATDIYTNDISADALQSAIIVPEINIDEIDSRIKSLVFCATQCLNIDYFLTGVGAFVYYYSALASERDDYKTYDGFELRHYWLSQGAPFNVPIDRFLGVAVILNNNEGYNWKKGDRLRVRSYIVGAASGTNIYNNTFVDDYEIIEAKGNVLFLDSTSIMGWRVRTIDGTDIKKIDNFISYEIYRPSVSNVEGQPYYAYADPIRVEDIASLGVPPFYGDVYISPFYSKATSVQLNGQPILFNTNIVRDGNSISIANAANDTYAAATSTLYATDMKESVSWSIKSPYATNWNHKGAGWSNVASNLIANNPVFSVTHLCQGGSFLPDSSIDQTGNFNVQDSIILPVENGAISELIRVVDNQTESVGAILLALCTYDTTSLYVNRTTLVDASGNNSIAISQAAFGSYNVLKGGFGLNQEDIRSVVSINSQVFWWDGNRKKVVRYGGDGLTPLSDIKMKTWFMSKPLSNPRFGFDYKNSELYCTFDESTVVFNNNIGRWVTFLTNKPSIYLNFGEFQNFSMWLQSAKKLSNPNPEQNQSYNIEFPLVSGSVTKVGGLVNVRILNQYVPYLLQNSFTGHCFKAEFRYESVKKEGYDTAVFLSSDNFKGALLPQMNSQISMVQNGEVYEDADPNNAGYATVKRINFNTGLLRIYWNEDTIRYIGALGAQYVVVNEEPTVQGA